LKRTASAIHAPHATGRFTAKLALSGKSSSLSWRLTFGHLSGAARRAGIYFGRSAKPSQLALLLCSDCSSGASSYYRGSYVASRRFVRAVLRGRAYVVIETRRNPKGEVRGRIKAKAT